MTSFTETFGGSAISPTDVAYAAYSFSTNLTLFWPQFSYGQTDVTARFMNMTATAGSLNVYMPNATLVSVGYDVLMVNAGTNTFNVVTENGNAICTIAVGQAFYILLNNNTTTDGTWQVIQFGVGTGAAVAAALAGAGLSASGNLLQQNILETTLSSTTTLTSTARAVLQVWNGGSGVINLPSASSVGNGFFFPFANDGTGTVTITPNGSDQIDGGATSIFNISQSAFIVSSGTAWFTVGKGLQNNFSVTVLNLNVAGSSNITETSSQAQNIIQQFTGILTGNIEVIMPATPQIYFIYNDTTGAYTLTIACSGGGSSVQVAQGSNTILYCDGTNIVSAFSTTIGSSVTLPVGTAGAPTLNFQGRTNTGLYSPAVGQVALTAAGYEALNITAPTSSVNYLQVAASSAGAPVSISALGSDTNITFDLVPKASGAVNITNLFSTTAAISGGTIDNVVIGGSTAAAITGTSITGTGQVKGNTLVSSSSITAGGAISSISTVTGTSLISTIATGTSPLMVTSTTPVPNLFASGTGTNDVTNSMLAQVSGLTIKSNITGITANESDNSLTSIIDACISGGGTQGSVLYRGSSIWSTLAPGITGSSLVTKGISANPAWSNSNYYQASPGNPSGTTSTSVVMAGLAGSITPNTSGNVLVIITGQLQNNNSNVTVSVQGYYGTGTAPSNGAAVTGTAFGSIMTPVAANSGAKNQTFVCVGVISPLTLNTAYWLDLGFAADNAGTGSLNSISISAIEFK